VKSVSASTPRSSFDLFLVSFLILFLELAAIRWFASIVVFLTFFTNIVLLATFVGMSVGCLAASSRRNLMATVIPLLLISVTLACAVLYVYARFGQVMIDVGGQGSPQQIYFGTEYRARDVSTFVVPLEVVASTFFTLIALMFIGLGQTMGRLLAAVEDRVTAYTVNIFGSLCGIAAMASLSYLQTPPEVWFAIAGALTLYFVPRRTPWQIGGQLAALLVIAVSAHAGTARNIWSPYYLIRYTVGTGLISTNNISHQMMLSTLAPGSAGYVLPHLLNRDAGGKPFERVLVIGAGSGNDVSAALQYGAKHVDAVEIDPAIFDIGRRDHPNLPYGDPRVTMYNDDGRSFLHRAQDKYDLIIYALVDSLVLHSGYSTVRLESFLFTREAFRDVKARLKPDGVFAAYNYYRQGWVVGRLRTMMGEVFGVPPLVIGMPYVPRFAPGDPVTSITFLLGGGATTPVEAIRRRLDAQPFWANDRVQQNEPINAFQPAAPVEPGVPPASWHRISPAEVVVRPGELLPSDDWPFLYLRDRVIPTLNVRGMAIIAVLSLGLVFLFTPGRNVRPNWQMFFMGAGFMLLETKSVVHLALLFGSTWMVNSIVVFAILVMILCSNLFVIAVEPARVWPYYVLLALALVVGIVIPMGRFLDLPEWQRVVASCAIVFLPIFFAGIVFATAFRDSATPDIDFGSNIAGAVLGGLSESLSLMIGFNYLLVLALTFYALSAAWSRGVRTPAGHGLAAATR
jgi:SAM-dependent methyltransferase